MTDNRTNEPTPEQVEAAAKEFERVWDENIDNFDPEQHDAMSYIKTAMRAALVAAQGAAPQAAALPETGNEMRDADGDLISSGKHLRVLHQGGYVCDTCTNVLGINVRWDHAIKRDDHAPVLPSSGVDEDKLAEVIGKARTTSVRDDDGVKSIVMESNEQIARAVAAWLKGQGNAARE